MNLEQRTIEAIKVLSSDDLQAVLDFAESLRRKSQEKQSSTRNMDETLFAHRGSVTVTGEQDFTAIRQQVIEQHAKEVVVNEP